jgi:hypothetical protein
MVKKNYNIKEQSRTYIIENFPKIDSIICKVMEKYKDSDDIIRNCLLSLVELSNKSKKKIKHK